MPFTLGMSDRDFEGLSALGQSMVRIERRKTMFVEGPGPGEGDRVGWDEGLAGPKPEEA